MGGEHPALSPFSLLPPPLSPPQPGSLLPSSRAGGREGQDCLEAEGSPFSHMCLRRLTGLGDELPFRHRRDCSQRIARGRSGKLDIQGQQKRGEGWRGRGKGEREVWGEGGRGRWGVGERRGREPPPSHWQPPQALLPSHQASGPTSSRVQIGPGRMPAS